MSTPTFTAMSTVPPAPQPSPQTEICQAIVFAIAGHLLALPLTAVLRVLSKSEATNKNSDNHLMYVEQQPVPIVDLRPSLQRLSGSAANPMTSKPQLFLLLVAPHPARPIAISIDEAPNLMTLSPATMQALPQLYRQQINNIASHVAVMEQQNQQAPLTILLLDLSQLELSRNKNR